MAGDWIKMRTALADDPAVICIADRLGMDEFSVVGRLHHLWSWADSQSRDGHAVGVTGKWIDRYVQRDGFAEAMVAVGWLDQAAAGISFPNFDRHNGATAKSRGLAKDRKEKQRSIVTPPKGQQSRTQRDKGVTREEKIIKDQNPLSAQEPVDPRMPSEMTLAWSPDATLLKTYAFHAGIDLALFTEEVRRAFTAHYESRGHVNTQKEWVEMLVKWVVRDKARNAASNVRPFPPRGPAPAGPDFEDTSWADDIGGGL